MKYETKNVWFQEVKFDESGNVAVVVQDYESGEVLFLAKMNADACARTEKTGFAHYVKGATVEKYGEAFGNVQEVKTVFTDATGETVLLKVKQKGNANLEDKTFSCFSKQTVGAYNEIGAEMFGRLQRIVAERRKNPEEGSYTSFMFARGVDKVAKKVGEEAVELVIAAKNGEKTGVVAESADCLYHMMLLWEMQGVNVSEVCAELCKRNR